MSTALVILPNFLLILIGLGLAHSRRLEPAFWDGLEKFIYYILFPALLFRSLIRTHIDVAIAAPLILSGALTMFAGIILSYAAKWLFKPRERLFASCFQCGFRFNTYIGFAIGGSLSGQPGIAAVALLAGVMIPLANVASVWVLARDGGGNWLRELVRNPLIIATVAGAAASLIGIRLPKPVDHLFELLASASLPMGLIAVGAGLHAMRMNESPTMMVYWLGVKLLASCAST
jgi:malonate transporter and related proteins